MEWMRYEAQHMKKKTYGGTLQGTQTQKGHQPVLDSLLPPSSSKPQPRAWARFTGLRAQQGRGGAGLGYLAGPAVDAKHEQQVEEVEAGEQVLCQADVGAAARGVVEPQEDVDETGRVTVGTGQ